MQARQIPLDFGKLENALPVAGKANLAARQALARENWLAGKLFVFGPKAAGIRQIAENELEDAIWLEDTAALEAWLQNPKGALVAIPDLANFLGEEGGESALFHLYNFAQNNDRKLLILSDQPLGELDIQLPDLQSRLATIEQVEIYEPDDDMMAALIGRGFHARGVFVSPELVEYLARRIERSYQQIESSIEALDQAAREKGCKISRALAKSYFEGEL